MPLPAIPWIITALRAAWVFVTSGAWWKLALGFWALLRILKVIVPWVAFAAIAIYSLDGVEFAITSLAEALQSMSVSVQSLPIGPYLAKANRAFPVTEFLAFMAIIFTVRASAFLIRLFLRFISPSAG